MNRNGNPLIQKYSLLILAPFAQESFFQGIVGPALGDELLTPWALIVHGALQWLMMAPRSTHGGSGEEQDPDRLTRSGQVTRGRGPTEASINCGPLGSSLAHHTHERMDT
jgi:hypothetical protein